MKRSWISSSLLVVLFAAASPLVGQEAGHGHGDTAFVIDLRDEFLGHFETSSYKITELARVMPEALYTWAPSEGVMTVAEVYTHLARYNFMYLNENLGIAPPGGLDYADLESMTDKQKIRDLFEISVQHVKTSVAAMTEEALSKETTLYGREVASWSVLFQLVSHMNEHVGQSVAYARMNEIAPPWSR